MPNLHVPCYHYCIWAYGYPESYQLTYSDTPSLMRWYWKRGYIYKKSMVILYRYILGLRNIYGFVFYQLALEIAWLYFDHSSLVFKIACSEAIYDC